MLKKGPAIVNDMKKMVVAVGQVEEIDNGIRFNNTISNLLRGKELVLSIPPKRAKVSAARLEAKPILEENPVTHSPFQSQTIHPIDTSL